jgi:hypothetical protein
MEESESPVTRTKGIVIVGSTDSIKYDKAEAQKCTVGTRGILIFLSLKIG